MTAWRHLKHKHDSKNARLQVPGSSDLLLKRRCISVLIVVTLFGALLAGCGEEQSQPQVEAFAEKKTETASIYVEPLRRTITVEGQINKLFDDIRRANLSEDINEFMKYYAESFPDRSGKEQKTLQTWQTYDFASLDYFIFDLKIAGERAEASVGWEIALMAQGASKPRLIETTNEVVLEKKETGWRIISLQ